MSGTCVARAQGVRLPGDYLEVATYSRSVLRQCMDLAPKPVGCARPEAAMPPSEASLAMVAAAAAGGAPAVGFRSARKPFCLPFGTASALLAADDATAANALAALAPRLAALPPYEDRMAWLSERCNQQLQPAWTTRAVRSAEQLSCESLLEAARSCSDRSHVLVLQLRDSRGFLDHWYAAASTPTPSATTPITSHSHHLARRGVVASHDAHALASCRARSVAVWNVWIFDSNLTHALPLSRAGLDACCLGDATFGGVVGAFQLERAPLPGAADAAADAAAMGVGAAPAAAAATGGEQRGRWVGKRKAPSPSPTVCRSVPAPPPTSPSLSCAHTHSLS